MTTCIDITFCLADDTESCANGEIGRLLLPSITVDGLRLPNSIDCFELLKSCNESGEFWIVTCSCGEPACASIDDGIIVLHKGDSTYWWLPVPLSVPDDERVGCRLYRKIFIGDRHAYVDAVASALDSAKKLVEACPDKVFMKPMWVDLAALFAAGGAIRHDT